MLHPTVPVEKKYRIIELCGFVDSGKNYVSKLLSKRIGAPLFQFPSFSPYSFSGKALLYHLTTDPEELIANPYWWASMYTANLLESAVQIQERLNEGNVIVTNYCTAFKAWTKAAGIQVSLPSEIPQPSVSFSIEGKFPVATLHKQIEFPWGFTVQVNKRFSLLKDSRVVHIPLETKGFRLYSIINTTTDRISECLLERFDIASKDIRIGKGYFLRKGERQHGYL